MPYVRANKGYGKDDINELVGRIKRTKVNQAMLKVGDKIHLCKPNTDMFHNSMQSEMTTFIGVYNKNVAPSDLYEDLQEVFSEA
jgi:hypothetical protein